MSTATRSDARAFCRHDRKGTHWDQEGTAEARVTRSTWRHVLLLVAAVGLLTGCAESVPDGFPPPPPSPLPWEKTTVDPAPEGNVGFQPPFLPIVFKVGLDGGISVTSSGAQLVT